jgi:hypothetical protein
MFLSIENGRVLAVIRRRAGRDVLVATVFSLLTGETTSATRRPSCLSSLLGISAPDERKKGNDAIILEGVLTGSARAPCLTEKMLSAKPGESNIFLHESRNLSNRHQKPLFRESKLMETGED